ncbi:MAG: hypothetical protein VX910_01845 [Candidatus Latescibacterota bacterium]|nr:hypothetical protein [Candidatus Latescibacterota bacterium]
MSDAGTPEAESETDSAVQVVKEVTMDGGEVNFGESDGEVSGDVLSGGAVRGESDLTVRGNVLGDPQGRCEIEVAQTVVFQQDVQHAMVRARHVVVFGNICDTEIHSDLGIDVRGALSDSDASMGYRTGEIKTLKRLRVDSQSAQKELSELEVRLASAGRKFVRDYHQVDLTLGKILVPTSKGLEVDLSSFYKALGDRSPQETDKALEEFYLRAIVGMLTRSNKHYVSQNPSRHKIFLKVIEELREHLILIRRADSMREELDRLKETKVEMLDKLNQPMPLALKVGAEVTGECRVRALHLSNVRDSPSGTVDMDEVWVEAKHQPASEGWQLQSCNVEGEKEVTPVTSPLVKGRFELQGEAICWIPSAQASH